MAQKAHNSRTHTHNKIMRFSHEIICHANISIRTVSEMDLKKGTEKGSKAIADNKFQSLITSINKMWNFGFRILIEIVSI